MKKVQIEAPLVVIILLILMMLSGVLLVALEHTKYVYQVEQDMEELVDGYYECLSNPMRSEPCYLEYDGNGGSNMPADWRWYWG